jgi:hypothetical protein
MRIITSISGDFPPSKLTERRCIVSKANNNYSEWSLQKLFNKVATHLIKQNKRASSKITHRLMFIDENGNRCAYGSLLSIKTPKIRTSYTDQKIIDEYCKVKDNLNCEQNRLMNEIEYCHDILKPSRWPGRLRAIAKSFELKVPSVLKVEK